MGKSLVGGSHAGAGSVQSTASTTWFTAIGTTMLSFDTTTEADAQTKWVDAGTFSYLSAMVITNARGTATTIRFRVAAANGSESVSCTANTTGAFSDTVDTDITTAGALVDYAQVTGTGTGNFLCNAITNAFDGGANYGNTMNSSLFFGGGSSYGRVNSFYTCAGDVGNDGAGGGSSTENAGLAARVKACTLSNFYVRVPSNTINASFAPIVRIALANGTETVSVGASTTGTFRDTVDTDAVTDNQLHDYNIPGAGSSGIAAIYVMGCWQEYAAGHKQNFSTAIQTVPGTVAANNFQPIIGPITSTATEANAQCVVGAAFTWSNLRIITTTNPTNAITFNSRINGVNGAQVASIGNGTHGTFEDTVDIDNVSAGQKITTLIALGASSSIQYTNTTNQMIPGATFVPPGQVKKPPPGGGPGGKGKGPGQQQFGYVQGLLYFSYGAIPKQRQVHAFRKLTLGQTVIARLKQLLTMGVG